MSMNRRTFQTAMLAIVGSMLLPIARAADDLIEGRDWQPLSTPRPSPDGEPIEVLEFFSYGCPHCSTLNPLIKAWAEDLPEDVTFRRVPVTFGRAAWSNLARLYFSLELDGTLAELDQAVFDAVTQQRVNLYSEKNIRKWIETQGLDADAFAKTFNSFAVEVALGRAKELESSMAISAVPRIVVDGRYEVVGEGVREHQDLLRIADALIEKARARRG